MIATHGRVCCLALLLASALSTFPVFRCDAKESGGDPERAGAVISNFWAVLTPEKIPRPAYQFETSNQTATAHFKLGAGRDAALEIDLARNEPVTYFAFRGFSAKPYPGTNQLSESALAKRTADLVRALKINTNGLEQVFVNRFSLTPKGDHQMIKYVWQRKQNGFLFKDDFIVLTLDLQDGELLGYKKTWGSSPPAFRMKIKPDTAREIATQYLATNSPGAIPKFSRAEPRVVSPNSFLKASPPKPDQRRLAWTLQSTPNAGSRKPVELWIDAETGGVLGGLE